MELEDNWFAFSIEVRSGPPDGPGLAGVRIQKNCIGSTWSFRSGTADDIDFTVDALFEKKGARIISINPFLEFETGSQRFNAIIVPNYGSASKMWWWGHSASVKNLADV